MMFGGITSVGEIVRAYWPVLAVSFLVSLVGTPLCRRWAERLNIVDSPVGPLKPHKRPIPYLGGVAIFAGWAAGVGLALVLFDPAGDALMAPGAAPSMDRLMMLGILLAGGAIMLLGLFDDLRLASPRVKLAGGAVVTVFLIAVGVGDDTIIPLLRTVGVRLDDFPTWLVLAYSAPLTLLITLGACNATNLIDGVDGLCSGVSGIISVGFLVLALHLHTWGEWHPLDAQRLTLSLAMMGAALGFLPYNRSPAKIFMGDAGSMLLGLNAAILLLLFTKSTAFKWMMGSLMVFGLPLADMVLTLARRWRSGRPLMEGDRSHFYDQLLDRGWSVRRVVMVSYALAAGFAVLGCIPTVMRTRYILPIYMLVVLAIILTVVKLGMVSVEPDRRK